MTTNGEGEVHPLENSWTLWENLAVTNDRPLKKHGYMLSYEQVSSFGTVEEFWNLWMRYPNVMCVPWQIVCRLCVHM